MLWNCDTKYAESGKNMNTYRNMKAWPTFLGTIQITSFQWRVSKNIKAFKMFYINWANLKKMNKLCEKS